MEDSDLTIILFALGTAVPVGLEAMKASGHIGRIGLWSLSGLLIAFAIFLVPLKKVLPAFVAWIGTAVSNPTAWLFLFFVAFICARPLWSKPTPRLPASADPAAEGDFPTVDEVTASLHAMMADEDQHETRMAPVYERIEALHAEVKGLAILVGEAQVSASRAEGAAKEAAQQEKDRADGVAAAITSRIREITGTLAELNKRADKSAMSFAAIWHRETMARQAKLMGELAEEMALPPDGSQIVVNKWKSNFQNYKSQLLLWCQCGEFYSPGLKDKMFDDPGDLYKRSDWSFSDDQFPDADAIHTYQKFCIYKSNFENISPSIDRIIQNVAFG